MNKLKTRIILVDDHPLVREWLTNLIHQQSDLIVCGEAETAPAALQLIGELKPDVAIVDISLKDSSGIELIKSLKAAHPRVAVIVLSMHDERLYAERALRAGARGYIMKRETAKKVIAAIRQVLAGRTYVSSQLSEKILKLFSGREVTTTSPLEKPWMCSAAWPWPFACNPRRRPAARHGPGWPKSWTVEPGNGGPAAARSMVDPGSPRLTTPFPVASFQSHGP